MATAREIAKKAFPVYAAYATSEEVRLRDVHKREQDACVYGYERGYTDAMQERTVTEEMIDEFVNNYQPQTGNSNLAYLRERVRRGLEAAERVRSEEG